MVSTLIGSPNRPDDEMPEEPSSSDLLTGDAAEQMQDDLRAEQERDLGVLRDIRDAELNALYLIDPGVRYTLEGEDLPW